MQILYTVYNIILINHVVAETLRFDDVAEFWSKLYIGNRPFFDSESWVRNVRPVGAKQNGNYVPDVGNLS